MLIDHVPAFDAPVPTNGYRWWYLDGISDDGLQGITVIAFIGSVFSPYYYRARQKGRGNPYEHCAINVALYSPSGNTWSMTERGARQLQLQPDSMSVARSSLHVAGDNLDICIDERSTPLPRRVRGTISVHAPATNGRAFFLDADRRHQWQPIAPAARIAVDFGSPTVRWEGNAYLDTNGGMRALEKDFRRWDWCRFPSGDASHIHYSVVDRHESVRSLAITVDKYGAVADKTVPRAVELPTSRWRIPRATQNDADVSGCRTLEDTPFYVRSMLEIQESGQRTIGMHESLSLERFERPWVRTLLPFRMPRISR